MLIKNALYGTRPDLASSFDQIFANAIETPVFADVDQDVYGAGSVLAVTNTVAAASVPATVAIPVVTAGNDAMAVSFVAMADQAPPAPDPSSTAPFSTTAPDTLIACIVSTFYVPSIPMTILFLGGVTEISTFSPQAISAPPTAAQSSLAFYAALSNKAGPVLGDTITNDISIKALATDVGGLVTQLTITVDSATPVVLNAPFGANATFNLPSQSLAFYAGGSLADGQHTVSLVVQDDQGNTASSTVTAILRRATPTLTGALANDTGIPGDGITSDDSITGTATNAGGLYALTGALDNGAVIQDFTSTIGAGGTYTISAARMGQFTGGTLPDGAHTLTLKAVDIGGTVTAQTISFTLRTSTPAVASFVTAAGQSSAAMANNTPVVLSMTDIIANAALRMGIDFASPIVPASAPAPSVEPIVMSDGSLMADQTGMLLAGVGSRQTHTLV